MKIKSYLIPLIGLIALTMLFFKMPETPNPAGLFKCPVCAAKNPYLALLGSGYFAVLIVLSLLFPTFPSKRIAKIGLIWAVLLGLTLSYIDFPVACIPCLISHVCHILIWLLWVLVPKKSHHQPRIGCKERLCILFLAPVAIVALFSSLNLTLMTYNKAHQGAKRLNQGDLAPDFTAWTTEGDLLGKEALGQGVILNFIAPNCPFCKEQLEILALIEPFLQDSSYRFVNVSPSSSSDLGRYLSRAEWIEDKEGEFLTLFQIEGYPTLVVIEPSGKLAKVIPGVPNELSTELLSALR